MSKLKNENQISVWGAFVAVFAFLCPFECYLSTDFGSILKFYTIACIIFAVIKIFYNKKMRKPDKNLWLLVALMFIVGFSVLWSEYMLRGVDIFSSIALQIVFIFLASCMTYSKRDINLIISGYIISSVCISVLLLTTVSESTMEMARYTVQTSDGTNFDPNNICAFIVCGIALLLPFQAKELYKKIIKIVFLAVMILAMLYTASRGGFVGFVIIIVCYILKQKTKKKFLYLLVAIFFVTVAVMILDRFQNNPLDVLIYRFADTSGSDRIYIWRKTLSLIAQKPFFGYGLGSSPYYISSELAVNLGSHNTYLTFIVESGVFSFVILAIFLISLLRKLKINKTCFDTCAFLVLVSSQVVSQFLDAYNKKVFWFPILICIIVITKNKKICSRIYKTEKHIEISQEH